MTEESALQVFGLDVKDAAGNQVEFSEKEIRAVFENTCLVFGKK